MANEDYFPITLQLYLQQKESYGDDQVTTSDRNEQQCMIIKETLSYFSTFKYHVQS